MPNPIKDAADQAALPMLPGEWQKPAVPFDCSTSHGHTPCFVELARVAKQCGGGLVYGGFVCGVVVLGLSPIVNAIPFKVWFRSQEGLSAYQAYLQAQHLFEPLLYHNNVRERQYLELLIPVEGQDMYFTQLAVTLVRSDDFPVRDFDTNLLTWDGDCIGIQQPTLHTYWGGLDRFKVPGYDERPIFTQQRVIESIHNHMVTPFPGFLFASKWMLTPTTSKGTSAPVDVTPECALMGAMYNRGWSFATGPMSMEARKIAIEKKRKKLAALLASMASRERCLTESESRLILDQRREDIRRVQERQHVSSP